MMPYAATLLIFDLLMLALTIYELAWAKIKGLQIASMRELFANVSNYALIRLLTPLFWPFYFDFVKLIVPFGIRPTAPSLWTFIAAMLLVDLCTYWAHRALHWSPLLWCIHQSHHSDEFLNTSISIRISILGPTAFLAFCIPAFLVGLPAEHVFYAFYFNMLYPRLVHSPAVGRLPGLEHILATPRVHCLHHAVEPQYQEKNFAFIFIFWDRLFGTYVRETVPPTFTPAAPVAHNAWSIQFEEFGHYLALRRKQLAHWASRS